MNKRKLTIIGAALLVSTTLLGAVSGSIAWFNSHAQLPTDKIEGSLRGAYFAYGDGSEKNPYGINIARHLYNLAWLQYSGYFNRDLDGDGNLDTYYFELDPEMDAPLDMTGYTLPPIGTERYPFLGEFNGNSKIITNLHASNNFNSFGINHPTTITTSAAFVQPQIVGLFGVVGSLPNPSYTYANSANKIFDLGVTNTNIATVTSQSLIGVVAGYVNGDISGVAVDASEANISAANTTALSYTSNLSDHGVVGYVAKSGRKNQITRVEETIYDLNISSVHEFNASDSGDVQGFGGSIDMKTLYNNILNEIWIECTNNTLNNTDSDDKHLAQYPTAATQAIAQDGTAGPIVFDNNSLSSSTGASGFVINGTENGYFPEGYSTNRRYYNFDFDDGGQKTASFGLIVETGTNNLANEKRYMCLSGERDIAVSNGATLTTSYYDSFRGSFIVCLIGGQRNYLNWTGSGTSTSNVVAADDASSTASPWSYSGSTITTKNLSDSTYPLPTYYLNCDSSGVLTVTTTNGTTWGKDAQGYYANVDSVKHYLGFNGTNWTTTTYNANPTYYYTIEQGGHYMRHPAECMDTSSNWYVRYEGSGTAKTYNSSNPDEEFRWYFSNNYFYATEALTHRIRANGTTKDSVICYSEGTTTNPMTYTASSGSLNNTTSTGYLRYGNNLYATYTNSDTYRWTIKNATNTLTFNRFTLHAAGYAADINCGNVSVSAETTYYSNQKTTNRYNGGNPDKITSYVHTNPTYIPLMNKKLANNQQQFGVPDPYNTGYIVSGAKYMGDPYGDIRVSSFPLTSEDNSLSGSNYDTSTGIVGTYYTVNDSGTQQTINKNTASDVFKDTTRQLEEKILYDKSTSTNADNVYGLHFMDAPISFGTSQSSPVAKYRNNNVGQSAYIEKAQLNNEEQPHLNYEVPTDCIDFHLKEKGYINFVAGTYYQANRNDEKTQNSSFFSLYQVIRNADSSIKELREISEVYATTNSSMTEVYSYQYKYDKSYTDNQGNSGQWSVPFRFSNSVKVKLDGTTYYEDSVQSSQASGFASNFKTAWIKGHKNGSGYSQLLYKAAYFFEIPMNIGEYCLGSVEGYNGAYLMYLDIGANAAKTYRTVMSEHFKTTETTMEYPLGIAILPSPTSITASMKTNSQEHIDLVCVRIAAGYTGTLRIARDATDATLINVTGNSPGTAVPTFQGDSVELNIAAQLVPKNIVQKDIKRIEYYDYSVNAQETTRVMITFTSTDGGSTYARDIKCYDASGNEITDSSRWKIYRTNNGVKFLLNEITYANLTGTNRDGLYYTEVGTTDNDIVLKARYWEDVATGETEYRLTVTQTTDVNGKQTFVFQDYKLEVTATGGSLTVKVLAKGSKTVYVGNTLITAVGQTIPIGA